VPLRPKRKWRVQALAAGCPLACGGENSQRCAAFSASFAKYLLGPADVSLAEVTLPEASTSTRTTTFTFPVIVFLALCGTSGITRCTTSPPEADDGGVVDGRADRLAAGGGCGALAGGGDDTLGAGDVCEDWLGEGANGEDEDGCDNPGGCDEPEGEGAGGEDAG
jgi:hypothetical protein